MSRTSNSDDQILPLAAPSSDTLSDLYGVLGGSGDPSETDAQGVDNCIDEFLIPVGEVQRG